MAENLNKHLSKLSKRGPHRVLVGDLDYAGLPGKIYTPAEGKNIPGIAFGHDWMKDISKYHATLRHLASWGIAVAAPNTEKGFQPNQHGFAADLESCLQILSGVRLGTGNITVSPSKLGVVGHGMGAAAAILAAAHRPKIAAVAALFPSASTPPAEISARSVEAPGLILAAEENPIFDYGNAPKIATAWKGSVAYRELEDITHQSLTEDTFFKLFTGIGSIKMSHRELIRGLTTGFLLHQLDGQKKYSGFSDEAAEAKKVTSFWGEELEEKADVVSTSKIPFLS
ncbi:alpha/beta hydrolase [Corynebacterium sp. sy017]|uniref:dienelactone hydrolase family protein n=1 Tax=unclassified Corynebacterium TaxID=2624378 RepID=UPI0011848F1F|nr:MULTISPECIES: dienelactone hydrolase family protein [unclassified Corynebacterium]MBP3088660.1 alpha/beta hydrolase [Corynebacterium sp. sy017]QDZ42067.1 alpha/beta hydrolase [Corynebacterium sp. sy039]TSD91952.1 alpha/beta hydrolase [Corynebacterium sp. SY003]